FRKDDKALTYAHIRETYDMLKAHTLEERITILGLNPDRADVIEPSAYIYLQLLKWANIEKIMAPSAGLKDGILYTIMDKYGN
ncbi:MAG: exopolyphosphatase, partial [Bacteroidota bacterium]